MENGQNPEEKADKMGAKPCIPPFSASNRARPVPTENQTQKGKFKTTNRAGEAKRDGDI